MKKNGCIRIWAHPEQLSVVPVRLSVATTSPVGEFSRCEPLQSFARCYLQNLSMYPAMNTTRMIIGAMNLR